MKKIIFIFIASALCFCFLNSVFAKEGQKNSEVQIEIHDDLKIKSDPSGEYPYLAIVGYGEASFDFGDREDILETKREAELYAKQRLALFLNEEVDSEETINKISKALKDQNSSGKTASKKTLKEKSLVVRNSAHALLKGCKPIQTVVNKEKKYVGVWYGFNQKTMRMADQIKADIKNDYSTEKKQKESKETTAPEKKSEKVIIQKSSDADDFL